MAKNRKAEKIEETGGELKTIPNERYQKFFDRFPEIETLEVSQWKVLHVLAYFCSKYQAAFGVKYQFKFNDPNPNKCYEVWRINTLCAKLSANPTILKEYIDWVFREKVGKLKRRFSSISFITNDDLVNYYKLNVVLAGKKDLHVSRSSPLTARQQEVILASTGSEIKTYGELAFTNQVVENGGLTVEFAESWHKAIEQLVGEGFDKSILSRLI